MISFAEIALNIPFNNEDCLTYEIPYGMNATIGKRVEVELGKKIQQGLIISIHQMMPNYKTKTISKLIDKERILTDEQIELAYQMKDFYLSTLGECIFKMIPQGRRKISTKLEKIKAEKNLFILNTEQEMAYKEIKSKFGKVSIHLLYGITGSGKTEVYIHLLNDLLKETDKSAILLVPEISLTVQTLKRLELIFGDKLALLHSAMKISEKFRNYNQILSGEKRIIIGTRSAIFAPVKNLGLIILDEEHDSSYKEHSSPRYHARQIAQMRAKQNSSVVVLGSATPSVESFYFAKTGKIEFHKLTKRAKSSSLSEIELVTKKDNSELISEKLLFKIKQRLDKKEQIILLLNRRGHSPLIYNRLEEKFIECPNCSSNLCYHQKAQVKCHLCGYKDSFQNLQNKFSSELELFGSGTQKLEEYILEKFPEVKLERLDQDSTKNKTVVIDVIQKLIDKKIDLLTGTQIIAKGLDAANVTLVGVINSTIGLGLPDFRAGERVFSLLTQVAGRAGRAELKGEVIIETNTDHPIIQLAKNQNYDEFFENEILVRSDLYFPPFCRLARIILRSVIEEKLIKSKEILTEVLKKYLIHSEFKKLVLFGPTEAPFYKIDNNFRIHALIKTTEMILLKEKLKLIQKNLKLPSKVYLEIDIDPIDLV